MSDPDRIEQLFIRRAENYGFCCGVVFISVGWVFVIALLALRLWGGC
jgi:hypothetical protein